MRSLNSITFLLIAGLPIIYANQSVLSISEVQFASVNDLVTLQCSLSYKQHLPSNVEIQWFDGPLPIKTGVNGITIKNTKTDAKLESLLIIDKVMDFHFGQYNCKVTGNKGQPLTADTLLIPTGTNDRGKDLITNISLTRPEKVTLKCSNNIPSENNNAVSWKKVQFDQTVISLDARTDSFYGTVSSLSETGKFICYNNNTVFHITYVYPQDYQPLKFTENLLNNATLVYNSTDSILLTCTVPLSTKPTELYWIFNNKKLTSDVVKRVHVPSVIHKDTGYELQLIITSPIPMKDAGTYTCVAENEWERIERHTNIKFDVSHADPFNIVSFSSQEYMIDGAEFTASCIISRMNPGTQLKVYMFYSNSFISLTNDTNTLVQLTTESYMIIAKVTIKNATVRNNGTYHCLVVSFVGKPVMQTTTTQFIERPVEIVNYYKDPIEQHSITCKAHVFATTFINFTTIQFTHHTNHHQHNNAVVYHPTSTIINATEKSITAHLDLKIVHGQRYHGIYECTTSASLLDKPGEVYSDSKSLAVEQTTKKHTASVLAFSVQSSSDQSPSDTPATNTVYIVVGVTVFVVATAVLLAIVVHWRLRSRYNLLKEPQYV